MIQSQAETQCSKCGEKKVIDIYKSINVAENPDLKKKVADGSLFLWECPHCGTVNLAAYDTLYHDPEKKVMIWLDLKNQISEAQMHAISNHAKAMGGYTLRLVSSVGELIEKQRIFEDGLDDLAIELCKWVTKQEMSSQNGSAGSAVTGSESVDGTSVSDANAATGTDERKVQDNSAQRLHYHSTEGDGENRAICFSVADKGNMMQLKIGWNVYEDACGILERNPSVRPSEGFARINADYIGRIIKG